MSEVTIRYITVESSNAPDGFVGGCGSKLVHRLVSNCLRQEAPPTKLSGAFSIGESDRKSRYGITRQRDRRKPYCWGQAPVTGQEAAKLVPLARKTGG